MKNAYSKFFNLERNPFGETPDPDFYYASHQHHHALSQLDASLRAGKGFTLLTGEVGTGKTLLTRLLLLSIPLNTNTALILFPKFTEIELLQAILDEFEVPPPCDEAGERVELKTIKNYVDHLNQFLLQSLKAGKRSVLMIDEAQSLSVSALETIRLLTNLETKTEKLLQIVLIAQPELNSTLDRPELRQLKQRVGSHAKLMGLDAIEAGAYIKSRIECVGDGNFLRFDSKAVQVIHDLSSGIPRRINQICEQVMKFAEQKKVRLITGKVVQEALGIKTGPFSLLKSRFA